MRYKSKFKGSEIDQILTTVVDINAEIEEINEKVSSINLSEMNEDFNNDFAI